jgi:hypothetical protein
MGEPSYSIRRPFVNGDSAALCQDSETALFLSITKLGHSVSNMTQLVLQQPEQLRV